MDAFGKPTRTAGAGEQVEEEVGVVLIERPQSLRDDLDRMLLFPNPPRLVGEWPDLPQCQATFGRDPGLVTISQPGGSDITLLVEALDAIPYIPQLKPGPVGDVSLIDEARRVARQVVACLKDEELRPAQHDPLREAIKRQ